MKLRELLDDIVNLTEGHASTFDELTWGTSSSGFEGIGRLAGEQIKLLIEPGEVTVQGTKHVFLNIAFARLIVRDDGAVEYSTELLNTHKNSSAIIGAVINAMKPKLAELTAQYDVDALVFMVVSTELQRLKHYRRWMTQFSGALPYTAHTAEVRIPGGEALVYAKSGVDAGPIIADLRKRGKILI